MKFQLTFIAVFISFLTCEGIQDFHFLPKSPGEQINHHYYILSYSEENEQANWVYYELTSQMLNGNIKRSNRFHTDPLVLTKSSTTSDYTKSGFDRGHLCPAADMSFDSIAMNESFYMSNISPQYPGFNRGIWKSLEAKVRDWAKTKEQLVIVTGPIFSESDQRIGQNRVRVPAYFYKILFAEDQNQMIAFVLPNEASSHSLDNFVSTVDSVEQITGIDFFSQLPDSNENQLESKIVLSGWFENRSAELPISVHESNNTLILLLLLFVTLIIIIFIYRKRF